MIYKECFIIHAVQFQIIFRILWTKYLLNDYIFRELCDKYQSDQTAFGVSQLMAEFWQELELVMNLRQEGNGQQ